MEKPAMQPDQYRGNPAHLSLHQEATPGDAAEAVHRGQHSTRYAQLNDLLCRGMALRLRFPSPLEEEFRLHQAHEGASLFRLSGFYVLGLFLALGTGLLIVLPPEVLGLWPLGYSTLAIIILAGILITRQHRFDPWYEPLIASLALAGIAIVTTLPALSDASLMRQSAMIGIIHACVVVGGMLGLRWGPAAVAIAGGGLAGLLTLQLLEAAPSWIMLQQTLGAGGLVGIVLAWLAEHRSRQVFLQQKLLELEKGRSDALAERMKQMSRHDGLTGLANRRYFDEVLAREWQRCRRDGTSLSLLFIDVDFFKPYNDQYGHQAGDQVLRRVGEVLAEYARRPGDLAARYGGEEFVLLYPQTGPEAAAHLAEQLRQAVTELQLAHGHSECAREITVSIGTSSVLPESGRHPDELVEAADHAVYLAKRNGRNRVESCPVPIR